MPYNTLMRMYERDCKSSIMGLAWKTSKPVSVEMACDRFNKLELLSAKWPGEVDMEHGNSTCGKVLASASVSTI